MCLSCACRKDLNNHIVRYLLVYDLCIKKVLIIIDLTTCLLVMSF